MKTSPAGLALIQRFEGLHDGDTDTPLLEPMLDPVGIPTLGWGAIYGFGNRRVTMDHPAITMADADELLRHDLGRTERAVTRLVRVVIGQNHFDAVVSLTYNIGEGNLARSTLLKLLNARDFTGAAREFPKWRKSRGLVLRGLVLRRAEERKMFEGEAVAGQT
jgi:lysozyme